MSLRSMYLDPEHIIEVIRCGRPGTGMPSHVRDPYKDGSCYGITQDTPGIDLPMQANSVLRSDEIAAVAEYVQANIQGKGEITFSECTDYWGEDSQNCRNLKSSDQSSVKTDNPEKVTK